MKALELSTYDKLNCPLCDKLCYPDAIRKNGTVIYNKHKCKTEYEYSSYMRHFEINEEGELEDMQS